MKRKYFGTDGIRGQANRFPMTADFALKLGMTAGSYFGARHDRLRVAIGKDTRRSCYMLEAALTAGLISVGAEVMLLGPIPTPGVGMLTKSLRADFGIMISASHNPFFDNGLKLFGADGFKLSDEKEIAIEKMLDDNNEENLRVKPDALGRTRRYEDAQARYIEIVKAAFPKGMTLEGMKIAVDCANGAAYRVAPAVLFELGAEVIPINVSPDGFNINRDCGSLHPGALRRAVLEAGADAGIALDGDADRVLMCDELGNLPDGDVIIAMIATQMKQDGRLRGGGAVTTVMSNMGLSKYLESIGLECPRTAVGDRYVVETMRECGYNLGGEQSGHIVLSDYASTGDGLLAALQVLAMMRTSGKPLSELNNLFTPYPQILKNIRFGAKNPLEEPNVREEIARIEDKLADRGRVLIRKSGTEPLIRVMAEAQTQDEAEMTVNELCAVIERNLSA